MPLPTMADLIKFDRRFEAVALRFKEAAESVLPKLGDEHPWDKIKRLMPDGNTAARIRRNSASKKMYFAWPYWWENGIVQLFNYSGACQAIQSCIERGLPFRVLEVRNNRRSGKHASDVKKEYKDTLFLEALDAPAGILKLYAGEAWSFLIKDPEVVDGSEFGEPTDEEEREVIGCA